MKHENLDLSTKLMHKMVTEITLKAEVSRVRHLVRTNPSDGGLETSGFETSGLETSTLERLYGGQFVLSTEQINRKFRVNLEWLGISLTPFV